MPSVLVCLLVVVDVEECNCRRVYVLRTPAFTCAQPASVPPLLQSVLAIAKQPTPVPHELWLAVTC